MVFWRDSHHLVSVMPVVTTSPTSKPVVISAYNVFWMPTSTIRRFEFTILHDEDGILVACLVQGFDRDEDGVLCPSTDHVHGGGGTEGELQHGFRVWRLTIARTTEVKFSVYRPGSTRMTFPVNVLSGRMSKVTSVS